ncbi:MAG: hypothetical protein GWO24_19165, partial [Akkermansiaceae bacterium]|nr:hypothetical protein [Akkermansiaceae bacterium]
MLRGDLDWIVMKALEKDRDRRYETADALAHDVDRFLEGEMVEARPPSLVYRSRKFARKHRGFLGTITVVVLALTVGTAVSVWQAVEANRARGSETAQRVIAEEQEALATEYAEQMAAKAAEAEKNLLDANYNLALVFEGKATNALEKNLYGEAWLYTLAALNRRLPGERMLQRSMERLSDSDLCRSALGSSIIRSEGRVFAGPFGPGDRYLATLTDSDHTITLWDWDAHRKLSTIPGTGESIWCMAVSRDGRTLAAGGGSVFLWDVSDITNPRALVPLTADRGGHEGEISCIAFSSDGRRLASGSQDRTVRLWDIADRTGPARLATLASHDDLVAGVAFGADGTMLASASFDRAVRLWNIGDAGNPEALGTLSGHQDAVTSVAFSPDGKTLASASWDHTVRLWNLSDPRDVEESSVVTTFEDRAWSVAYSPDGRILACGSADRTVRLLDAGNPATSGHLATLSGHRDGVSDVRFGTEGRIVAFGSWDQTIRLANVSGL